MVQRRRAATDADGKEAKETEPIAARMEAALAFIKRAFRENPAIDDIAKTASVSPFYFHRLFRKRYGKTPKQFVLELQIAEVQRLALAGTSLQDAAELTGFSNPSHMSMRFKQLIGLTPAKWRRAERDALNTSMGVRSGKTTRAERVK